MMASQQSGVSGSSAMTIDPAKVKDVTRLTASDGSEFPQESSERRRQTQDNISSNHIMNRGKQ